MVTLCVSKACRIIQLCADNAFIDNRMQGQLYTLSPEHCFNHKHQV